MKRAPRPEDVARFVRWALLLFFAYALWNGFFHFGSTTHPQPTHTENFPLNAGTAAPQDTADCATRNNTLDNFSMVASALLPRAFAVVRSQDITVGKGANATCGQHATLRYAYTLPDGKTLYSNMKDTPTADVTIGSGQLLHGAELGLIGMQPGGQRKMAFPAEMAFGRSGDLGRLLDSKRFTADPGALKSSVINAEVSLLALSPEVPAAAVPLRIIERKITNGSRAQCGDTVQIGMTLWRLDGTKLFSTEDNASAALAFTIGASQVPYGIALGVGGMAEGAERTILLPPAYRTPLLPGAKSALGTLILPDEMLLAEVRMEHVSADEPAPAPAADKTPLDTQPDTKHKTLPAH